MRSKLARHVPLTFACALLAAGTLPQAPCVAGPKNVIIMIADGAGFNTWNAASMYMGRWDAAARKSRQVYDGEGWIALASATYPLTTSKIASGKGEQDRALVYDPERAWDPAKGYEWLKAGYTDSAAAATVLSTGQRTYNNAINWSDLDRPLKPTMTERAKASGRATGVLTTVQWSHATPAGFSNAHVRERDDYEEIARQMLEGDTLDVIIGAGNPDFDNNGLPATKKRDCKYVGGETFWKAIEDARSKPDATFKGFRPVSTKQDFLALAAGPTPRRLLGTFQASNTLRQARAGKQTADPAKDTPINPDLPDLPALVRAALNTLDENPRGLFLLVEGGAVDWANHSNQAGRMIQEQKDFVNAVEAVVRWIETHSSWEESLLVLTADHETGLLWGPDSDTKPFDPVVDRGPGVVPGLRYNSKSHTNSLVPLYARGAGSERFKRAASVDPVRGPYTDHVGVAETLAAAIDDPRK